MDLVLRRYTYKTSGNYIIGRLFLNDVYLCDTLENYSKRVPLGSYPISVTYSSKFGMSLPLLDVPGRLGIRIHAGNTSKDTTGCILVGNNSAVGMVTSSRLSLINLMVNFSINKISNIVVLCDSNIKNENV